jgi:YHS domain-containing protein
MPDDRMPPAQPSTENLVCGRKMTIAPENYYPAEYQGRVIYFCTHFCLETFIADPERFYIAHSRSGDTPK